jgi:SAM-dependent methyltransferase
METQTIQRQYDEVIAPHYDLDPQAVLGTSLNRAAHQIRQQHLPGNSLEPLRVLDLGVGTGLFLAKLKALAGDQIQLFGLDLSEKMIDCARDKIPDLIAEVGDAANFESHFPDQAFDLICTHFITGFVPLNVLAPKIGSRLEEGGYWSLVGGTMAGFPVLQAKVNARLLRWTYSGRTLVVDDVVCNPAGRDEVVQTLARNGFEVCETETFEPALTFPNFDEFMSFAYRGGWLTPFIERLGLHRAGAFKRWLLNRFFFPVEDHHSIEIVLARKVRG